MPSRIQLRRDTAAAWTSANPTLSSAELGVETDTGKFKIGDGASTWTALAYAAGDPTALGVAAVLEDAILTAGPAEVRAALAQDSVVAKALSYEVAGTDSNSVHEWTADITVSLGDLATDGVPNGTLLTGVVKGAAVVTFAAVNSASFTGASKAFGSGTVVTLYKKSDSVWEIVSPLNAYNSEVLDYAATCGLVDAFRLGQLDNLLRWAAGESCRNAHSGTSWDTLASNAQLVAAWFPSITKNIGSGDTVYGLTGHNGTRSSSALVWGARGMTFPGGSGEAITVPDHADFDFSSFTLCGWNTRTDSITKYIVSKYEGVGNRSFYLQLSGAGILRCFVSDGTDEMYLTANAGTTTTGVRAFVAGTFAEDPTQGTIKIFKDGVEVTAATLTGANVPAPFASTGDVIIGASGAVKNNTFNGPLDMVAIFARPLTAAEQVDLMAITDPTKP